MTSLRLDLSGLGHPKFGSNFLDIILSKSKKARTLFTQCLMTIEYLLPPLHLKRFDSILFSSDYDEQIIRVMSFKINFFSILHYFILYLS